jgi:predicted Ser/Thr protein kinase
MTDTVQSTATAARDPEAVLARQRAYAVLAAFTLAATVLVWALGRNGLASAAAIGALVVESALLATAAAVMRLPQTALVVVARGVLLALVAALTGPIAWFYGPNGPFAAFLLLVLLMAGVLREPGRRGAIGVAVYVTIALSQSALVGLVLAGVLDDRSLVPLRLPGHPDWHHAAGHAAIEAVYLAGFVAGRALARRYDEVSRTIEEAERAASLRAALLEEARADYRRAVQAGRAQTSERVRPSQRPPALRELEDTDVRPPRPAPAAASTAPLSAPTTTLPSSASSTPAATPATAPGTPSRLAPRVIASTAPAAQPLRAAYEARTRGEQALLFAMGILGCALLGVVGPGPVPTALGTLGILAIALIAVYVRGHEQASTWGWAAIGVLSVLPAYCVGLHSGFACVIAIVLFFRSAFDPRGDAREHWTHVLRRDPTLPATMASQAIAFVLVAGGAIPDAGNAAVLAPLRTPLEPWLLHACVQSLYVLAFALGLATDRRQRAVIATSEEAARRAAREEAQLRAADADLRRALAESEPIFAGEEVGPYVLERLLASGGMGDVYEARRGHTPEAQRVAVKLIRRERADEALSLALFEEEAAVLARVQSPYVAAVLGVSGSGDALPYIAMELIEGATLATILRERGRLSMDEVRALVRDVSEGLRAVHAAGVIHRDLKPHNVMLTTSRDGARWKIVDFGVAQLHDLVSAGAALVAGTPSYMAPEQALGERVDARADLYALCLVAYRALSGRPAFTGDDRVAIATSARAFGPPDPTQWAPIPRDVELALRLGLASRPEERFGTARELGKAFDAAFEGRLEPKHRARAEALLARMPWSRGEGRTAEPDAPTRRSR